MGQINTPKPVKLIVAMISQSAELFAIAIEQMQKLWGEVDIISDNLKFDYTKYYKKEMGENLLRKFVSFENLIDPGEIAGIKHKTNEMEEQLALTPEGKKFGVDRPINLDPGYIEPAKLVLATTKNFSHRIYIGENMFAEVTLYYKHESWHSFPFTFPDYASGDYNVFLDPVRAKLLEQTKKVKN
ncbi:MAG: DUF4416 family protein [Phycisphaerae bacterium]|nr:DUF4416 family protein [Phycisphaerae bacterium]